MAAPKPHRFVEAVEEIMKIYRSLPPRPSLEEVAAAIAVIESANSEEEAKLEELGRMEKHSDLPDELFYLLQEAKKNMVLLQGYLQKREALHLLDLDKRFQAFDMLIQRAFKLVSADDGGCASVKAEQVGLGVPVAMIEKKVVGADWNLVKKGKVEKGNFDGFRGLAGDTPMKSSFNSGGDQEKLSLIKVASLFETSAKSGTGVLDLQGKLKDEIEWLPVSLGKLVGIRELNLSENYIMDLPPTIGSLRFLTKLDLHSNKMVNLPESFCELSSLSDLDLHNNRLKFLPPSFGNLTSLVNLDLGSNQLSLLPESLGNLTNLKRLSIETNELEELPYTIGSCCSLAELRVDFNHLRALPEAIGKIECLEVLTLHYNRIKNLPTTMSSLSRLKELDVSFNELESIPESLCFATSLVKLNVSSNFADLRMLPRSIGNLEMLEELNISNSQIKTLPESFRFLSKLRVLYADETPLEVPPRHVVKLGAQAVVQYMADLVKPKNLAPQPIEKMTLWFWFCSLFRPQTKEDHDESLDSTKA